jgi:hypothetical protein
MDVSMARKSRTARLGSSHVAGNIDYAPKEEDWAQIESAFGNALGARVRAAIIEAVRVYFLEERFERHAPHLRDSMYFLDGVDSAARKLMRKIVCDAKSQMAEAAFHAQDAIGRHMHDPLHPESDRWDAFRRHVTALIAAVSKAKREFAENKKAGLSEGAAWSKLIRRITAIAERRGLPIGASKATNKPGNEEPSPFVRMVRALQETFPMEMRRHSWTYYATAEAISVARRTDRKKKAKSKKPAR